MSDAKIWFVTGASSGFGRAVTEHMLSIGNKVVATLRNPGALDDLVARYSPTQLLVVKVDVTKNTDITAASAETEEVFGRIDVVFNNAGVAIMAEVESLDETGARQVFDVNFWGAASVAREAVRFFQPMGGWLLQVSSILGLVGFAVCGFYSAPKFALEGLTECLVDELDPAKNIRATIIEPGEYRTEIKQKNYRVVPQHPAYADPALHASQARKLLASPQIWNGDVTKAAIVIEKLSRPEDALIRFPLHKRVIEAMKDKSRALLEAAIKYESWTEDLYHDD